MLPGLCIRAARAAHGEQAAMRSGLCTLSSIQTLGRAPRPKLKKFVPKADLDAADLLDVPPREQKLSRPLKTPQKQTPSPLGLGILEATASDITDDLNLALTSTSLRSLFANKADPSQVVTITEVVVNKDCSHADARWDSPHLTEFIEALSRRSPPDEAEYRLVCKMTKNLTQRLQAKESKFRTHLIKTMTFRRVPRVFFKPCASIESALQHFQFQIIRASST